MIRRGPFPAVTALPLGQGSVRRGWRGLPGRASPSRRWWSCSAARAAGPARRPTGCSSELRGRPGVLALTFHVDYWDYLGWKDTLASPDFSQRQYDYAKARGDMDVFTPQMVVNGEQADGGKPALRSFRRPRPVTQDELARASLRISDTAKEMVIEIGAGEAQQEATLWVMPVMERASVKIEKGEMAGREVDLYQCGAQARSRRHVDGRGGADHAAQGRADARRRHRLRGAAAAGQGWAPFWAAPAGAASRVDGHARRKRPVAPAILRHCRRIRPPA